MAAIFYIALLIKDQKKKEFPEQDRGNWNNKISKLRFLKEQIFRCLIDLCAANKPRKVGEEHAHVTPLIVSSMIFEWIIYLVFIEKRNNRTFVVFVDFSDKN